MPDPTYVPPTQSEMRTIIARTLRDPSGEVFGHDILNDIINEGMADLTGYRPVEATESWSYDPGQGATNPATPLYLARLSAVWQVELRDDLNPTFYSTSAVIIPYTGAGESDYQTGWDVYEGALRLGRLGFTRLFNLYQGLNHPVTITAWGYRDRNLPTADGEVLDLLDNTDFLCLTKSSRMLGFQLLNNDRALYQQWLAATNNTDVSPTQLQGMLNLAEGDYDRQRRRSTLLRRVPTTGPQYP